MGGTQGKPSAEGQSEADRLRAQQEALDIAADWADISQGLRKDLGQQLHSQWIKPIQPGPFCKETGTLDLYLPTEFSANWVSDRFADRLSLAWKIARPDVRHVRISVSPARRAPQGLRFGDGVRRSSEAPVPAQPGDALGMDVAELGTLGQGSIGLDPSLTFATFVSGSANVLASNAAQRMAATETPQFAPLYLKAATGQGKTHLLHAIGHAYLAAHPRARIFYCSAE
ncbi:MAG: chromosomal replication initiator protein DnaA, partial [Sphingomonadaceae bacterium]|nr:chromosomal replication initiator protein DnaA [Sphingomonadaceae bacterium]